MIRKPLASLFAVSWLFATASCGGTTAVTFTLVPNSTTEVNDGQTATTINAAILASGVAPTDGTSVTFTLPASTGASFTPIVAGSANTLTTEVSTGNGIASTPIYDLSVESVAVTVSADITSDNGGADYTVTGGTTVKFGGLCPDSFVSKPPASLQTGVANSIDFTCTSASMGGIFSFDQAVNQLFVGNAQTCFAQVTDASQQTITNAAVEFRTEAGSFETDVVTTGQNPTELTDTTGTATVTYRVSQPYPSDVVPTAADGYLPNGSLTPRAWTDANGHTYNPRDGWVTMIAAVAGYSPSPQSEPYVDANDNGAYDPGETYIDVNCNGTFDAQQTPDANGLIRLWTTKRIVWTDTIWGAGDCTYGGDGTPGNTGCAGLGSGFLSDSCAQSIGEGSRCDIVFRFLDINLNLPATFGVGNTITFSAGGASGSDLTLSPSSLAIDALSESSLLELTDYDVTVNAATSLTSGACPITADGTFLFGDPSISSNSTHQLPLNQTLTEADPDVCFGN